MHFLPNPGVAWGVLVLPVNTTRGGLPLAENDHLIVFLSHRPRVKLDALLLFLEGSPLVLLATYFWHKKHRLLQL